MKLVQVRVRGLAPLSESRWFELSSGLNLFEFQENLGDTGIPAQETARSFFKNLETINPPYDLQVAQPFARLQQAAMAVRYGHYTRRIAPEKRTVALAVFSSSPPLVQELASINQHLYETDRIEVGRRLDYSRWLNFVELASSSRWSEVAGNIKRLLAQIQSLEPGFPPPLSGGTEKLQPTERIKGQLEKDLVSWLQNLPERLQEKSGELIADSLLTVMRASHFQSAKQTVRKRMPLFVQLDGCAGGQNSIAADVGSFVSGLLLPGEGFQGKVAKINEQLDQLQFPGINVHIRPTDVPPDSDSIIINGQSLKQQEDDVAAPLRLLQAKIILTIAGSTLAGKGDPIFLFPFPHENLTPALHLELREFILLLAKQYQCLYSCRQNQQFSIFDETDATRTYKNLTNTRYSLPMEIDGSL